MKIDWLQMTFAFAWSMSLGMLIIFMINSWNAEQFIVALQEQQTLEAQSCNLGRMDLR